MLHALFPTLPILFLFLITPIGAIPAQDLIVLVQGQISDQNGAVIPNATIVAESSNPDSEFLAVSGDDGLYKLSLLPGTYNLEVSARGFVSTVRTVEVRREGTAAIDFSLIVKGGLSEVTVPSGPEYRTDAISSATKTMTLLRDTPQSVTVVSKEQISDQSMQSVSDVVNYVPGISSHQGENNRDQVVIRGNSTSADLYLNGVRDDVQYYRDLYNVERVETLKGPNSMAFGRGGGGGVINRVAKEALFSRFGELTFQGGSFADRRGSMDWNRSLNDNFAIRMNGFYERSNSFRRFVQLNRYGFNPTITVIPDSKSRATVSFEHLTDRRIADRGIPSYNGRPVEISRTTYFGNPNDSNVRANVNILSAMFERQMGPFVFRDRMQFGNYDRGYQNYVPGVVSGDRTLVALSAYNNATKRKNLFNQTDLSFSPNIAGMKHLVLFGAEIGRQATRNFRNTGFFRNAVTSVQIPFDDPATDIPVRFRQNATDANNKVNARTFAGYVQDQIELSKRVIVFAGARFDYFDLRFHNNRNFEDLRRIDRLVSPRAGIVFKPVTDLSLYGSYSVAYLPGSGDQFSSLTVVTQQVKPEKFENYEIGAKWDLSRFLSITSALYRQDRKNTRATDPNNPGAILQTGSQRTNGFEAGINGNVFRNCTIAGGYAYQNAFITSATTAAPTGARVAMVPRHDISLWNRYQATRKLGLGLGLIRRTDVFAAIDDRVILPGYTRFDAAVFYNISENIRVQVNIENLFDTHYFLNADGNNNISPGSPRAARARIVYRF